MKKICNVFFFFQAEDGIRDGRVTGVQTCALPIFGAASGVVAGLVAITPSCGAVNVVGALIIGFLAGVVCALAVGLKYKLGYDDSLEIGRASCRERVLTQVGAVVCKTTDYGAVGCR